MKLTRSGLVALVFLAGCAVGGASSQFVVPPATAQNVQRWDYLCMPAEREVTAMAKKAGAEGWEMVAAGTRDNHVWCFKRPM